MNDTPTLTVAAVDEMTSQVLSLLGAVGSAAEALRNTTEHTWMQLTCDEADALARVFERGGAPDFAQRMLMLHAYGDEDTALHSEAHRWIRDHRIGQTLGYAPDVAAAFAEWRAAARRGDAVGDFDPEAVTS